MVPKRTLNKCTVLEALTEEKWVEDIPEGEIDMAAMIQYLDLWDILNSFQLNEDIPDRHI
jgi:hypothetical protein